MPLSRIRKTADALAVRLGRVTSGTTRFIPLFDGLRFFAIAFVVLAHTFELFAENRAGSAIVGTAWFEAFADIGVPGVKLFFVISGFILALPFLEARLDHGKPVALRKYFLRRITRLEPPYIVAISIWLLVHWLVKHRHFSELTPHYFASLTYSHIFCFGQPSTLLWAAWSLEIEIQFYVLAPFLFALLGRRHPWQRRAAAMLLVGVDLVAVALLDGEYMAYTRFTLLGQLPFFMVGFLLADIYLSKARAPDRRAGWDVVASMAWLAILAQRMWLPREFVSGQLIFAALVGLAYHASANGLVWPRILSNRWLVIIGGMCYSIYLYHRLVLSIISERLLLPRLATGSEFLDLLLLLGCTSLAVLAICALIFVMLERPCMRPNWPTELWNRLRSSRSNLPVLPPQS